MRIAVTGAAGYIGPWLCRELTSRGHLVWAQDVHPVLATAEYWSGGFCVFDLFDADERRAWLHKTRPDAVIHLAALYGRVWGENDRGQTARDNAGLTAELARDCGERGIRLVYVSSSEVYGLAAEAGKVREISSDGPHLRPLNMYGLSKKWGEEAAQLYAPDGLIITRLNMPYGPSLILPRPGEIPHTSGRVGPLGFNALHTILWQATHGMDIAVHRDTYRCYTWAGDAMRGLSLILESGQPGVYNCSRDDDHHSAADIARRAGKLAGSSSVIRVIDPPPGVTTRKFLDNARLLDLGWQPEVSLDEGMRLSLEFYSKFDRDGRWQG